MKKRHYSHGELNVFETDSIPDGAKRIMPKKGRYILADSEVTGNHHCLQDKEDVEVYEKDGVLYIVNKSPIDVFCVVKERHDTEVLPPSIWEIETAKEYDYISQEVRNVAD